MPPKFCSASGDVIPWREACKRGRDMIGHSLLFLVAGLGMISTAVAQGPRDPAVLIAAQREAMVRLAYMDGIWRGPAWTILDSGQKHTITQTERIGPFLSGSLKVIEGRGYDADGTVSFNAFGTISYDSFKHDYILHSYAQGYVGDFVRSEERRVGKECRSRWS